MSLINRQSLKGKKKKRKEKKRVKLVEWANLNRDLKKATSFPPKFDARESCEKSKT